MRRLSSLAVHGIPRALLVFVSLGLASTATAAPPKLPPAGGVPAPDAPPSSEAPGSSATGTAAPTPDAPAPDTPPAPPAEGSGASPAMEGGEESPAEEAPADDGTGGDGAPEEAMTDEGETAGATQGDAGEPGDANDPGMVMGREEPSMQSIRGGVGLFHTLLPRVGARYSFRFRVHNDFFRAKRLFVDDADFGPDTHTRIRSTVNLGFTFTKFTEIYFALHGISNRNERVSPTREDPETLFALGDMDLGIKGAWRGVKGGGVGIGGNVGLNLVAGSGRLTTDKVGFYVDGVFGADLRYLTERAIPVRLTANVGYFADQSSKVTNFGLIEDLPSREVARFGLNALQPRVRTRIAVDAPIRFGKDRRFGLDPILEFSMDTSVRKNEDFEELTELGGATPTPRLASWLTLGVRANVYDGLQLDIAADIGTTSPNYEYGPPVPPWQINLGLGWSFDPVQAQVEVPAEEAPEPELPPTGRVVGNVVDGSGAPVADARISIPASGGSTLLTDINGAFVGYSLPPGPTTVILTMPDTDPVEQSVEVVGGEDAAVTFTVEVAPEPEPEPEPEAGVLNGSFVDGEGKGVAGTLRVRGQGIDEDFVVYEGGKTRVMLPYGPYEATMTAEGYKPLNLTFTVDAENVDLSGTLEADAPPETPNISASSSRIRLRRGIRYRGEDVSSASHAILDELAVFLKYHPEYKLVEVQVHTDDRGNPRARSKARAESVIRYLAGQGVEEARLRPRGLGDSSPVAVNLTEEGRRKNNRTLLRVREYTGN